MDHLIKKVKLFSRKLSLLIEELSFSAIDFIKFQLGLGKLSHPKAEGVVFCGTMMHARIARLAKWQKKSRPNHRLILICKKSSYSASLSFDVFDSIILYRSKWDLMMILKGLDSKKNTFHLFAPPYEAAHMAISHLKESKKFYDYQDLIITNFGLKPPFQYMKREIEMEKEVLKKVDGIICNSLELQTAKKYYSEISEQRIYFPNYVDPDAFLVKTNDLNQEIHLVFVGSVHSLYRNRDYFGGQQLHWFINKMNDQKVHFHIYPAPTNLKEHLVDYYEMDSSLEYFHLHEPVPQKVLAKEILKYDFGVIPFFHRTNKKLDDKRYYSTALKMFNYFESNLPVILGEDTLFQNHIGRTYGGAISASWEDFDDIKNLISKYDYKALLEAIRLNREKYRLDKRVNQVLEFYKD